MKLEGEEEQDAGHAPALRGHPLGLPLRQVANAALLDAELSDGFVLIPPRGARLSLVAK